MTISIITLFPEIFSSVFSSSILARATRDKIIKINFVNLRDFGIGPHHTVDDKPYGGGTGMVLRVDVLANAIKSTRKKRTDTVILLDPKGQVYNQKLAEEFSKYDHLIFVCGRYEGYDERVRKLVDFEISIGDFVTSGGEIPAMAIIESVARLVPGVLKKEEATDLESFSETSGMRILEHPQYTRPAEYDGDKVPKVLLSGDPAQVNKFRLSQAKSLTRKKRPDLIRK